jgi:hypothetical protein
VAGLTLSIALCTPDPGAGIPRLNHNPLFSRYLIQLKPCSFGPYNTVGEASLLIAQASSAVWLKAQPILWIGLGLILAVIVFGIFIAWYRKRSLSREPQTSSEAWTLDDLRRMRADGTLTEDEYQQLRATLIAALKGGGKADSSPEKRV